MANTKITELTATSIASANDLMVIVTDTAGTATTKKITVSNLFGNVGVNSAFNANVSVEYDKKFTFGNSSVNNVVNSTFIVIANSTVQTNVSNKGIKSGIVEMNTTVVQVGSNNYINASVFFSGNSTSNLIANSTILQFKGTSSTFANLNINGLVVGVSTVNLTGVYVGLNVALGSADLRIGNSTVNVYSNSSTVNVGSNVSINTSSVQLGNNTTNRVFTNNSVLYIGNNTINAIVNSTSIKITNSTSNVLFTLPTAAQYTATNIFLHANSSWTTPVEHILVDVSRDETTTITTGTAKYAFYAPYDLTLTQIPIAMVSTNSTSGVVTLDVNKNGVSMLGTAITIDANEPTSNTAATPGVLSSSTLSVNDKVTIDVDTAGTGAKGLKVAFFFKRT